MQRWTGYFAARQFFTWPVTQASTVFCHPRDKLRRSEALSAAELCSSVYLYSCALLHMQLGFRFEKLSTENRGLSFLDFDSSELQLLVVHTPN